MPSRRRTPLGGLGLALVACAVGSPASALTLRCGAQRADIEIDARFPAERRAALAGWVRHSLDAVGQVYGAWPLDRVRVAVRSLVAPGDSSAARWLRSMAHALDGLDAVPWGEVQRTAGADPPTVLLVVNPLSGIDALTEDWVAYHELSHLFLPYRASARWFIEGLATYYQNVVQARAGALSERQMWQNLHDGLVRGRLGNRWPKDPLWLVDEEVSLRRAYMRVYWTGTLYWLGLDVALRRAGGVRPSLDDALLALRGCCQGQRMHAWRIAKRLDALSATPWFTERFDRYVRSLGVPAHDRLLAFIGVRADSAGRVSLRADAPGSGLRARIAKPRFAAFRRERCKLG